MGVRDKALLLVGFAGGGRRRSELSRLRHEDITRSQGGYTLYINRSKTDQEGQGLSIPLYGEAAHALRAWLVKSGLRTGPVFRGIYPNQSFTHQLTGQAILDVVRRRAKQAGYEPSDFGAHSLRSGFVTEAGRQGIHLREVMALTGHRSVAVALNYYRNGDRDHNPATQLLNTHKNEDIR